MTYLIMHEYVELDLDRVVSALSELEPIEQLIEVVAAMEGEGGTQA